MKYIKKFEKRISYPDYNIGDIVIVLNAYESSKALSDHTIKNGDRCIITSLDCYDDDDNEYVKLESLEDGSTSDYHKRRIISEEGYFANKYNI